MVAHHDMGSPRTDINAQHIILLPCLVPASKMHTTTIIIDDSWPRAKVITLYRTADGKPAASWWCGLAVPFHAHFG